jgi:mersacidin/lichenicidin family type 2 lantibiotic
MTNLKRKEVKIMKHVDVIRAWKDPEYRLSLSDAERLSLPAHPAGLVELTDSHLARVEGGAFGHIVVALGLVLGWAGAHKQLVSWGEKIGDYVYEQHQTAGDGQGYSDEPGAPTNY